MNKHALQDLKGCLEVLLSRATRRVPPSLVCEPIGGSGDLTRWHVMAGKSTFFAKVVPTVARGRLLAERAGLRLLGEAKEISVPELFLVGGEGIYYFLLEEYLPLAQTHLSEEESILGYQRLGETLAELHRHRAPQYGGERDNFLGASLQRNVWDDDWAKFFIQYRLTPQLDWAVDRSPLWLERVRGLLKTRIPAILGGHQPIPSLLHGDLWHGNVGLLSGGIPVIFDPAVYYGDRETDLAMTEMFGGFPIPFYQAYDRVWAREEGYTERREVYQLYHWLNHYNLFGDQYSPAVVACLDRISVGTLN